MGIGVGIFLIAVGLILALAVDYSANGVDIAMVGWIMVGAGVLGILLDLIVFGPRRREGGTVVEERRTYADPALREPGSADPDVRPRRG